MANNNPGGRETRNPRESFFDSIRRDFIANRPTNLGRIVRHGEDSIIKVHQLMEDNGRVYHYSVEGFSDSIPPAFGGTGKRKRSPACDGGPSKKEGDEVWEDEDVAPVKNDPEQLETAARPPNALPPPPPPPPRGRGPVRKAAKRVRTAATATATAAAEAHPAPAGSSSAATPSPADTVRVTRSRAAAAASSASGHGDSAARGRRIAGRGRVSGKGKSRAARLDREVDQITAGIDGFSVVSLGGRREDADIELDLDLGPRPDSGMTRQHEQERAAAAAVVAAAGAGGRLAGTRGGVGSCAPAPARGADVGEWLVPVSPGEKVGRWLDSTANAGTPIPIDFPGSRAPSKAGGSPIPE